MIYGARKGNKATLHNYVEACLYTYVKSKQIAEDIVQDDCIKAYEKSNPICTRSGPRSNT